MPNIDAILRQINKDLVPQFEEKLRAHLAEQDKETRKFFTGGWKISSRVHWSLNYNTQDSSMLVFLYFATSRMNQTSFERSLPFVLPSIMRNIRNRSQS